MRITQDLRKKLISCAQRFLYTKRRIRRCMWGRKRSDRWWLSKHKLSLCPKRSWDRFCLPDLPLRATAASRCATPHQLSNVSRTLVFIVITIFSNCPTIHTLQLPYILQQTVQAQISFDANSFVLPAQTRLFLKRKMYYQNRHNLWPLL